ncbi:MAG: hypothetical protein QOH56_1295, partial [Pseudonocardiales bacterium]|nr:hypothetical protein [Pseudonocardiales bacterium]
LEQACQPVLVDAALPCLFGGEEALGDVSQREE